jgi:hypothetical protein
MRPIIIVLTGLLTACGSGPTPQSSSLDPAHAGQEVTVIGEAQQDGDVAYVVTEGVSVRVERLVWPAEVVGTSVEVTGLLQRLRLPPAIGAAGPKLLPSGETTPTVQESYDGLWHFRLSDVKWYPLRPATDAG